jgi:hypothetical protein
LPFRSFCNTTGKEALLAESDRLNDEIAAIGAQLEKPMSKEERDALNQELSTKTKRYWEIERMPTWPGDVAIFRNFVPRTAVLLLPLIAEASGLHEGWVKVLEKAANPGK